MSSLHLYYQKCNLKNYACWQSVKFEILAINFIDIFNKDRRDFYVRRHDICMISSEFSDLKIFQPNLRFEQSRVTIYCGERLI